MKIFSVLLLSLIDSFENFLEDMGKKPSKKHQLDRIKNDGNYEPSNCRWSTPEENIQNSSRVKFSYDDVINIRNSKENILTLCKNYNVRDVSIYNIKNRKHWKNVE